MAEKREDSKLLPCLALWRYKSKAGKTYYSGKTETGRKVIAFINENATQDNKQPRIRVYYDDADKYDSSSNEDED